MSEEAVIELPQEAGRNYSQEKADYDAHWSKVRLLKKRLATLDDTPGVKIRMSSVYWGVLWANLTTLAVGAVLYALLK